LSWQKMLASLREPYRDRRERTGPVIIKALKKVGMTVSEVDLVEINEAFASMPLVSTKILAEDDMEKWEEIKNITNVNGDAIAIGHPVGASGARILMTLMYESKRRGGGMGAPGNLRHCQVIDLFSCGYGLIPTRYSPPFCFMSPQNRASAYYTGCLFFMSLISRNRHPENLYRWCRHE